MKATILALALVWPGMAAAQFALSEMTGTWAGEGSYTENMSTARMRCRLNVQGSDAQVHVSGRCASSLGSEDFNLDFVRLGNGDVVLKGSPDEETGLSELRGRPGGNGVTVSAENGLNRASLTIVRNDNGTMSFVTDRRWRTGRSKSAITLVPR